MLKSYRLFRCYRSDVINIWSNLWVQGKISFPLGQVGEVFETTFQMKTLQINDTEALNKTNCNG